MCIKLKKVIKVGFIYKMGIRKVVYQFNGVVKSLEFWVGKEIIYEKLLVYERDIEF